MIADTREAVIVKEYNGIMFDPVFYLPREDIKMELLEPMKQTSRCPIKGTTTKFALLHEDKSIDHAT
ncbi:MAG: DUF427 domain-containing protein, partial [Bacteroidota bacterium]